MRAIEMGMQVVDFTIAIAAAKRIFERTGAVVDAVHQVMRQKKSERTEKTILQEMT
jgi:translation elongation factor EF-G